MPDKTLYVRPEDEPVWAEAAARVKQEGRSLSALVADALQCHVARRMAIAERLEGVGEKLAAVVAEQREILDELTVESIEAGTYDQPAEVITLTSEEYQQAVQNALDSIGCTMDELADMASRGDYPTPAHRKVWLAIKPAPAQPETSGE